MSSLFDFSKTNLSYYTIPASFILIMVPHSYAVTLGWKNYDLANPRRLTERCAKDEAMDKKTVYRIQRGKAATDNGFESAGLFAAGVVAANVTGVATARLNTLTLAYLVSRVAYNAVYVLLQDDRRTAPLRSACWAVSVVLIGALWVDAGNASNGW